MKKTKIDMAKNDGGTVERIPCPAYTSPKFPRLAIHRAPDYGGGFSGDWTVTHIMSGYSISRTFRLRRQAQAYAARAAIGFDWGRSKGELQGLFGKGEMGNRLGAALLAAENAA